MLSYQHAYHAGNPVDVFKHTLWGMLLSQLAQKPKPLHVFETHAGRGLYTVDSHEMQKLAEYEHGIAKLPWNLPSENPYLTATRYINNGKALNLVAGSPAVAARVLRPEDHLHLFEAHPMEFTHLQSAIHRPNLHLHMADGHTGVPSLIRSGQRNVVLIDPSYEVKAEYAQTVDTVAAILKTAPQTPIMVWYPLLAANQFKALVKSIVQLQVSATWQAEYIWEQPHPIGLHGSGQLILNLPYQAEQNMEDELVNLKSYLGKSKAKLKTNFLVARK